MNGRIDTATLNWNGNTVTCSGKNTEMALAWSVRLTDDSQSSTPSSSFILNIPSIEYFNKLLKKMEDEIEIEESNGVYKIKSGDMIYDFEGCEDRTIPLDINGTKVKLSNIEVDFNVAFSAPSVDIVKTFDLLSPVHSFRYMFEGKDELVKVTATDHRNKGERTLLVNPTEPLNFTFTTSDHLMHIAKNNEGVLKVYPKTATSHFFMVTSTSDRIESKYLVGCN